MPHASIYRYNLLSTFPQPHLGGAITNIMTQVVLPFNMLGSLLFLGTRYKQVHYVGAILVIYGVLINLMPFFLGQVAKSPDNKYYDPNLFWIMLNTVATVFAAASNIYTEVCLKDYDLDVWYANAWIATYQLVMGIVTCWTLSIQVFTDPNPAVSIQQYGNYFYQATRCFFGYSAVDVMNGDSYDCNQPILLVFCIYIFFNIIFNMLMLYVFKKGSSVLFVVSSAVALPLADFLYMIPLIAGPAIQAFTLYDGFALFIMMLALYVYYSQPEIRVVKEDDTNVLVPATPMFPGPNDERAHLHQQVNHLHHPTIAATNKLKSEDDMHKSLHAPLLRSESLGDGHKSQFRSDVP